MENSNATSGEATPEEQAQQGALGVAPGSALSFSGTTAEGAPWHADWLHFTDSEYYHRIRGIMLTAGMGEGDVEMIIANVWESAWINGKQNVESSQPRTR